MKPSNIPSHAPPKTVSNSGIRRHLPREGRAKADGAASLEEGNFWPAMFGVRKRFALVAKQNCRRNRSTEPLGHSFIEVLIKILLAEATRV